MPIGVSTDRMHSSTEPVSLVSHVREELKEDETNALHKYVQQQARKRWDLISDFSHAAAYTVDPRFRTEPLPILYLDEAESYFKDEVGKDKWVRDLQPQFHQYRRAQGPFAHDRWTLERSDNPRRPWQAMALDPTYCEFAQLALETLSIPTGIASVERTVSGLRRIHTWQRNRLSPSRVDKLVFVHQNLRFLVSEDLGN